jgi:mRNA-degrading endonuclease RelE of RelBE toxin-antitoxin system
VAVWTVSLRESVIDDLKASGRKQGRVVLKEATIRLSSDPLATRRHLKSLRPNPVAHRELRLFGRYRVLFSVDETEMTVTIVLIGEKRRNSLYVQVKGLLPMKVVPRSEAKAKLNRYGQLVTMSPW